MTRIKVDPEQLRTTAFRYYDAQHIVEDQLSRIGLAWDVLEAGALDSSLRAKVDEAYYRVKSLGRQVESDTHDLANFLSSAATRFLRADSRSVQSLNRIMTRDWWLERSGLLPTHGFDDLTLVEILRQLGLISGDLPEGGKWDIEQLLWITTDPLALLEGIGGSGSFDVETAVMAGSVALGIGALGYGVLGAEASGSGYYDFGDGVLKAGGQLHAEAYLGKFEYNASLAGLEVAADGWAGAEIDAEGALVFDPASGDLLAGGSLSAFAGVRAGIDGSADLGPLEARGHAGVRAGIGVDASAKLGVEDGVLVIDFNLGASLGVGFDLGFAVDFDVGEAADTLVDTGSEVIDFVGDGIENLKFW